MKDKMIVVLALVLYFAQPALAASTSFSVPPECENLALMQAQLLNTRFHNDNMGDGTYNPPRLTLRTNDGMTIGNIEYLGGDGEDENDPKAGQYPCDLDSTLCTNPADAGGPIDWARLTITSGGADPVDVAQVVVSMGGRGGCTISSAKAL